MREPVRVMVVDDSAVIRGLITRTLEREADIQVVASAANGQQAVERVGKSDTDVVVLDIEMPVMDGLAALPGILAKAPQTKVIIASTLSTRNAEISLRAMALGAADYLPKPSSRGLGGPDGDEFSRDLIQKVRTHGRRCRRPGEAAEIVAPTAPVPEKTVAPRNAFTLRRCSLMKPAVLAIGSSTGGPQALFKFLKGLGPDFPLPILITQHMPATFTRILAGHIAAQSGIPCREAEDGDRLVAGEIRLAPGGHHMTVGSEGGQPILRLNQEAPENFCRPAVDPLFRSLAALFGAKTLAVVLTGMGSDGLKGGQALVAAGGTILAQDEASSVVWGMPGAVATANICSAVAPLDNLANHVTSLVSRGTL